jgi:nucleotide-binding universal stress UspA family protein
LEIALQTNLNKKVLVAYDGTREGHNGLLEFANTLPQLNLDIHLLAVIRISAQDAIADTYGASSAIGEDKQRYESVVEEGKKLLTERGYKVTTHLAFGDPIEQIVGLANDLRADLIVVGHRRRSSFASRWWSKSVGASLLEQSPCSILVAVCD